MKEMFQIVAKILSAYLRKHTPRWRWKSPEFFSKVWSVDESIIKEFYDLILGADRKTRLAIKRGKISHEELLK